MMTLVMLALASSVALWIGYNAFQIPGPSDLHPIAESSQTHSHNSHPPPQTREDTIYSSAQNPNDSPQSNPHMLPQSALLSSQQLAEASHIGVETQPLSHTHLAFTDLYRASLPSDAPSRVSSTKTMVHTHSHTHLKSNNNHGGLSGTVNSTQTGASQENSGHSIPVLNKHELVTSTKKRQDVIHNSNSETNIGLHNTFYKDQYQQYNHNVARTSNSKHRERNHTLDTDVMDEGMNNQNTDMIEDEEDLQNINSKDFVSPRMINYSSQSNERDPIYEHYFSDNIQKISNHNRKWSRIPTSDIESMKYDNPSTARIPSLDSLYMLYSLATSVENENIDHDMSLTDEEANVSETNEDTEDIHSTEADKTIASTQLLNSLYILYSIATFLENESIDHDMSLTDEEANEDTEDIHSTEADKTIASTTQDDMTTKLTNKDEIKNSYPLHHGKVSSEIDSHSEVSPIMSSIKLTDFCYPSTQGSCSTQEVKSSSFPHVTLPQEVEGKSSNTIHKVQSYNSKEREGFEPPVTSTVVDSPKVQSFSSKEEEGFEVPVTRIDVDSTVRTKSQGIMMMHMLNHLFNVSGWQGYVLLSITVVSFLVVVSLMVLCGTSLHKRIRTKRRLAQMEELSGPKAMQKNHHAKDFS